MPEQRMQRVRAALARTGAARTRNERLGRGPGPLRQTARRAAVFGLVGFLISCQSDRAEPLRVAVSANFGAPLNRIAVQFRARTGAELRISPGSTGKLTAQIINGAPFDLFLAADAERPAWLEREGRGVAGSRFTYAFGRLALCGRGRRHFRDGVRDLREATVRHFAIANPAIAPYGVAAEQVLRALGLWSRYQDRLLRAENVTQAAQFVEQGGAELGLLAWSSVIERAGHGCWLVPEALHQPIRQDAILLTEGARPSEAQALAEFLKSPEARAIIEQAGYRVP